MCECAQSYRYYPSNIEVIEWLGAYYIDAQFCEKAVNYFERASIMQSVFRAGPSTSFTLEQADRSEMATHDGLVSSSFGQLS
jgi:hypothetical protein